MKLRGKLKKANVRLENQEKMIVGLERGNRYLHDVCERTRQEAAEKLEEAAQNNELMLLLLAGCALAAGGEIRIRTDNMKRALEGKRIQFQADLERHEAVIAVCEE